MGFRVVVGAFGTWVSVGLVDPDLAIGTAASCGIVGPDRLLFERFLKTGVGLLEKPVQQNTGKGRGASF